MKSAEVYIIAVWTSGVGVRLKVGDKYWEDWRGGIWGAALSSSVGGLGLVPRKKNALKLCNSEQVLVLLSYITAENVGDYPQSWKWGTYPLFPLLRRVCLPSSLSMSPSVCLSVCLSVWMRPPTMSIDFYRITAECLIGHVTGQATPTSSSFSTDQCSIDRYRLQRLRQWCH